MTTYKDFKDKDGIPLVITVEYQDDSWSDSIDVEIFTEKEVSHYFFWSRVKLVRVKAQGYRLNLTDEINCESVKVYATRTLDDYNYGLECSEKREALKKVLNGNCK